MSGQQADEQRGTLPDWGLEPPQWTEEPAAPGGGVAQADPGNADDDGEPEDPAERLTWRSEANNPWSLDDEDDNPPPPVVGGD